MDELQEALYILLEELKTFGDVDILAKLLHEAGSV
jgi:hypothetical protein